MQIPKLFKQSILQFTELYHQYKVDSQKLKKTKYRIHSSLAQYNQTGTIQLSFNDNPGDLLPSMSIKDIKKNQDLIAGLHPIDVNTINDLYYLSQDQISNMIINEEKILVKNKNGQSFEYNIKKEFNHENLISKRVSFLIGYIQAEKFIREAYLVSNEKYKIIRDNISTLDVLDNETNMQSLKSPLEILFSDEYKYYSKEDIAKIGFICGQMSKV